VQENIRILFQCLRKRYMAHPSNRQTFIRNEHNLSVAINPLTDRNTTTES